jgi:hypothetical protein
VSVRGIREYQTFAWFGQDAKKASHSLEKVGMDIARRKNEQEAT